jgi:hypothetical protein
MSSGGSKPKDKGSAYERKICRLLSLWVSERKRPDLFWRSALSGGRSTIAQKKGEKNLTQSGDITAIHSSGEFLTRMCFIECKAYADLELASLVFKRQGTLWRIFEKVREQSSPLGKIPLLIAKQDYRPQIVVTNEKGYKFLSLSIPVTREIPLSAALPPVDIYIMRLTDLLNLGKYGLLKQSYEARYGH